MDRLADEYFSRRVLGVWKHPNIIRSRIERDIKPVLGKTPVAEVTPMQIDALLKSIVDRGAPTTANDVLRLTRNLFDYAITRHITASNPAAAFTLEDAGGKESSRTRALSREELVQFFAALRTAKGLGAENIHTFKLLLLLAVRKGELTTARVEEFNLDQAVWHLPGKRTKTGMGLDIPLPPAAVAAVRELIRLGGGSYYLLPARKAQSRMLPYINENTLNVALTKIRAAMPGVEPFVVHDLRRTVRTRLAELGIPPHICERCLNHRLPKIESTYDTHDYLEERRRALVLWADYLEACEAGRPFNVQAGNVVPLRASA